jgi:hypothetical protein
MMALKSEPCPVDFRCEKGKLALHLRRRSGQEVQNQKDEPTVRTNERIQKVSNFQIRAASNRIWKSGGCLTIG